MPGRWRGRGGFYVRRNCRIRRQFRFFFLRIPTLARARQGSDAGEASTPGKRAREAMPGRHQAAEPSQSPGSLLYVLYEATEHPLSPVPCFMCYMCYISQGKPLNIHSPRVPCYMCYMCYISQGKPLNIHSPGFLAICAICAIWYRSLCTIHIASQHVPNMPCIAHTLHLKRVQNI